MGWEMRGRHGPYYYQSVRDGRSVHKVYWGRGDTADLTARLHGLDAAARAEARAEHTADAQLNAATGGFLDNLRAEVADALERAGYHQHHGEYRRRRK